MWKIQDKFPSPYGVTVIKSNEKDANKWTDEVSVPLWGNGN